MPTINTYPIYRSVYMRHKNAKGLSKLKMAVGLLVVKEADFVAKNLTEDNLNRFRELEDMYLDLRNPSRNYKRYWIVFRDALKSGDFEYINNKKLNLSQFIQGGEKGIVYVCQSDDKSGQVKIGRTKMDLYQRLRRLFKKYDYDDLRVRFAVEVDDAVKLERLVHSQLNHLRVTGRAKEDSVEWFNYGPIQTKKLIFKIIEDNNITVRKKDFQLKNINAKLDSSIFSK